MTRSHAPRALALTLLVALAGAPAPLLGQPMVATTAAAPTIGSVSTRRGRATEVIIRRETFSYATAGRRDPYGSLIRSSDLRPLLGELRLTAVAFDPDGNNSVAILRDLTTQVQYRLRVGQQVGRLRVTAIQRKAVQFTVEEFGFNRTETLVQHRDTTTVRNP